MSEQALRLINECYITKTTHLDLGRCSLKDADVEVGSPVDIALRKCTHLQSLVLSTEWWGFENGAKKITRNKGKTNKLSIIPPAIADLAQLSSLVCGGKDGSPWNIHDMSVLAGLTSLRLLNLSYNRIENICGLDHATTLIELALDDNNIQEIKGLHNLPSLTRLSLSLNPIAELKGLDTLTNLEYLFLYHNKILSLTGLEKLTKLKQLLVWSNQISEISGLETLKALETLELQGNQITAIKGLEQLTQLWQLDLSNNKITEIKGLNTLTNLYSLNLSANRIPEIKGLDALLRLQRLLLFSNRITEIKGLENLTNLKYLHISINGIQEIKGLDTLTNLESLDLSSNNITELKGLTTLTNLTSLDVHGNKIAEIKELDNLLHLSKLILRGNRIQDIAPLLPVIQKKPSLKITTRIMSLYAENYIEVGFNPLIRPTIEMVNLGNEAILNYFNELKKQGTDYLYEAKLLIVGQPRAGKTSLRYKLFDSKAKLPAEDKTTRGIDIDRIDFDIKDREGNTRSFFYNIWDFGGQQIYQATHQFFLTHRSLYVLVVDTGKDSIGNDDATLNYWLQAVELLGGNSPLLLVLNEKNERKIHLDLPQKRARFSFLKECYQVDLNAVAQDSPLFNRQRKDEFDKLKRDIESTLTSLPLVGIPMPKNWVQIREALQTIAVKTAYITLEEYQELCAQFGVTGQERQLELSRIFHDLGVFLHFQDYGILDDFIVLQNTWATDAVFAVLDNTTVRANNGRFTDNDLSAIWESRGYAREVQKKLLGLMMQFEMCYQVDRTKPFAYIVPEMLPDNAPENYSWLPHNDLPLQYRYDFMPRGLLTRLIVRLNRNIHTENGLQSVWKTGIKIDGNLMDCPNSYAEITEAWDNRQLSVRAQGRFARDLMSKITYEIDELNKDYFKQISTIDQTQKSKWYKMIPCNCITCRDSDDKHFYDYSKLLERKEYGKDTIECEKKPFAMVDIHELMDGIFSHSKGASHGNKQGGKKLFISYSKKDLAHINQFIAHLSALRLDGKVSHWYCTELAAGTKWDVAIQENFDQADMVVFMISPHFMNTPYIHEHEIKKAFERQAKDPAFRIVPVILNFCQWSTKENNLQQFTALPYTEKPVMDFNNQDMAWYLIVECLSLMIEKELHPTGAGFYTNQPLPKKLLSLLERIVAGQADA